MIVTTHFQPKPASSSPPEVRAAGAADSPKGTPEDRATSFEAQQGNPIAESRSGEQLLVEAYIFIWIIAIVFVGSMWMRQRAITKRLADLEAALDRAAAKAEEKKE